jgi:hypothetical protein
VETLRKRSALTGSHGWRARWCQGRRAVRGVRRDVDHALGAFQRAADQHRRCLVGDPAEACPAAVRHDDVDEPSLVLEVAPTSSTSTPSSAYPAAPTPASSPSSTGPARSTNRHSRRHHDNLTPRRTTRPLECTTLSATSERVDVTIHTAGTFGCTDDVVDAPPNTVSQRSEPCRPRPPPDRRVVPMRGHHRQLPQRSPVHDANARLPGVQGGGPSV